MEIAIVRLHLNKQGDDLPKNDVTPAEAMFLHVLHGPYSGGKTFGDEFSKITVVGTAMVQDKVIDVATVGKPGDKDYKAGTMKDGLRPRTDIEELARLRKKYSGAKDKAGKPIIDIVFPNRLKPELPQKFSDIKWKEVDSSGIESGTVNYATGGLAQTTL